MNVNVAEMVVHEQALRLQSVSVCLCVCVCTIVKQDGKDESSCR
jgi:hypothetical protein